MKVHFDCAGLITFELQCDVCVHLFVRKRHRHWWLKDGYYGGAIKSFGIGPLAMIAWMP